MKCISVTSYSLNTAMYTAKTILCLLSITHQYICFWIQNQTNFRIRCGNKLLKSQYLTPQLVRYWLLPPPPQDCMWLGILNRAHGKNSLWFCICRRYPYDHVQSSLARWALTGEVDGRMLIATRVRITIAWTTNIRPSPDSHERVTRPSAWNVCPPT